MKLIIQIPCYNEETTLPVTIKSLPKEIKGIDKIETLIIDDGSSDNTVQVAKSLGVNYVVRHTNNRGLAAAFMTGLNASLSYDADIIVNTDADNQYDSRDIEKLIEPILSGKADFVIGERPIEDISHFSFLKKKLQRLGSLVVRKISGTNIPDVTSGFRALNKETALKLNVISNFTYTLETIIQAGKKNLAITYVPIQINSKTRESRLFSNIISYIKKSISTIFRIYMVYEPLKVFMGLGAFILSIAFLISFRFLYFYFTGGGQGHVQSLIFAAVLFIIGFQIMVMGLMADLIGANRNLIEDLLYKVKKLNIQKESLQNSKNSKV